MNRVPRYPALVILSSCLILFYGCGGGSGGSGGEGRVAGQVLQNSNGGGGRAATPIIVGVDDTNLTTTAAADGTFTINHVPPGLHTIVAKTTGGAVAVAAMVQSGVETNVGDVALQDAGQVSGLVTNSSNHAPVPNALITATGLALTNTATMMPQPVRIARTDQNGSYTLGDLPVGPYLVAVNAQGFQSASLMVTVTAGTTTSGDVSLASAPPVPHGSMSGTAFLVAADGSKQPLDGVLVRLAPVNDPLPMRPMPAVATDSTGAHISFYPGIWGGGGIQELYTFTDSTGAYKLDNVPAGNYTAVAVRPGLDPDSKPVTITANANSPVDFQLKTHTLATGTVQGTVTNAANSQPIAGAHVSLVFRPGPIAISLDGSGQGGWANAGLPAPGFIVPDGLQLSVDTDAQGHYQLTAPVGQIALSVYADGFSPSVAQVVVPAGGSVTADVALSADANKVTLSGTVYSVDASGKRTAAAGATVLAGWIWSGPPPPPMVAFGFLPPQVSTATTDAQGQYKLALRPGNYTVSAMSQAGQSPPVQLNLTQDATQDFTLSQGGGGPPPPPPLP